MYRDPARIRKHVTKVRFDDVEDRLVEALCDFTGEQKAVLMRQLILEYAQSVLHGDQSGAGRAAVEGTVPARLSA